MTVAAKAIKTEVPFQRGYGIISNQEFKHTELASNRLSSRCQEHQIRWLVGSMVFWFNTIDCLLTYEII